MIDIITKGNQEKLAGRKYIELPWKLFDVASNWIYSIGDSAEVERVILEVEGCRMLDSGNGLMIESKFNGVPLSLSKLSTGSQVILCIYFLLKQGMADDKVIDITECGSNAIRYILRHYSRYDLELYLGHKDLYGDLECRFMLNGEQEAHRLYDIIDMC